jgi:DNA-binding MarR family transcriptional regulator
MSGKALKGKAFTDLDLNRIIHEHSRLMILTFLASSSGGEASFTEIRDELGLSAGNLSVQMRTLEEAGYVSVDKSFVDNKSRTEVSLTSEGHKALGSYLDGLELIVSSLKASRDKGTKEESDELRPASGERD